ncbi:hypothetical protein PMAYCL1PPCAC_20490, partial [Pristionchus mayeri]
LLLLGLVTLLVYGIIKYYKFTAKYPKGPCPLPFVGNFFQFDFKNQYKSLQELGKDQSGIYTVFSPIPMVQITNFDLIREAFIEKGTRILHLIMRRNVQVMVANVINELLFGYRYKYDDCQPLMDYVLGFNKMMQEMTESPGLVLALVFPRIRNWPFIGWHTVGKIRACQHKLNEYIVDNVDRVLEKYDVEDEPTCFVHAYKQKMGTSEHLHQTNLIGTCCDFFDAGMETTTTTLRWAMLFLAKHQDVQDKLRAEILEVVGTKRLPEMTDQPKMPYARACVLEIQRRANILQINIPRVAARDVTVGGHTIPAGAWVNGDIHYLMANDPLFENPDEFRPERYLHEDGKTLRKELVDRTIPFSIGKRACAGEGIARVELFLGLTATVQHYRIFPCVGQEIDLEYPPSAILIPKEQLLRIKKV